MVSTAPQPCPDTACMEVTTLPRHLPAAPPPPRPAECPLPEPHTWPRGVLTAGAREDTEPGSLMAAIYRLPAAAPHARPGPWDCPAHQAPAALSAGASCQRHAASSWGTQSVRRRIALWGAADPRPSTPVGLLGLSCSHCLFLIKEARAFWELRKADRTGGGLTGNPADRDKCSCLVSSRVFRGGVTLKHRVPVHSLSTPCPALTQGEAPNPLHTVKFP